DYGVYHSAYDSFHWMSRFGDPDFVYHVAAAQLWGTVAMRLADADGLPFNYSDYARQIREFFNESLKNAKRLKLADGLNDKEMTEAIDDFAKEAGRVEVNRQETVRDIQRTRVEGNEAYPRAVAKLQKINDVLIAVERDFVDERGLRGRPWYRHHIYAPGLYTGYAAQPLPDFRQGLDDRNSTNAKESLQRIIELLKRATKTLREARD
ncbi:MAG: transferrin receptor-like dimerization domain-containing protein, partial [Pyrinomonadaceae bacterium]